MSENDCLAQTSSHHFTVLVTGLDFALSVEKKIESILHSFEQSIFVNELEFDLTVSIGVCFCPQDGETLAELISHADLALENVRANEKSAMRIYNSDLSLKAAISLNMRQNLKKAIENDEIHAYFQPQVDIGSGLIIGLEALAPMLTVRRVGGFGALAHRRRRFDSAVRIYSRSRGIRLDRFADRKHFGSGEQLESEMVFDGVVPRSRRREHFGASVSQ